MKKKALTVIIPMILILLIAGGIVGKKLIDKYSYSTEEADMDTYFGVNSSDERAIILQDEMVEEQIKIHNDICYLDLDTIKKYLNETFYVDENEQLLLYTTAMETYETSFGQSGYTNAQGDHQTSYEICYRDGETIFVALDYVKLFTNFSYEVYDRHVQIYTEWGVRNTAELAKKSAVRLRGGIKSPILRRVEEGETVEVLEQMETWCKVKTSDSIIGYVENKHLTNEGTLQETPVTDVQLPEYTSLSMDQKVSLAWHAIGGVGGNDTLSAMINGSKGLNVIAPTWFSLCDEEGNFRSFAASGYVEKAHAQGLQVWAVWDDFNYENETGNDISVYNALSSTTVRRNMVDQVINAALQYGVDGVNIDFETIGKDSGPHFAQFLRELSIRCREQGLVLSVDNYVPLNFNDYYRLDIQGLVADYVIIMGYDEHWHGCSEPGSVASIDYVTGGIEKTLQEVPAAKVVNALPFYTRVWTIEGANVTDSSLTIANTADFLGRIGVEPIWDETTCQNYLEWGSGAKTYRVWLEDKESLKAKLNVMTAHDIAGVAVWEVSFGNQEVWELISAYANS